ncbi:hypothetical protein CAter282_4331 [Collimonas arenae]|uniref:Uncharacterized protein n=2 Tax=Collimonas arenae TaxID=279058 RepID=A0A127QPL1_9BURK|nr:hypothetical protein CAter282_4331 [Collimonas arenae]
MAVDQVKTNMEALQIARDFATDENVNEGRVEAYAETWFDARKDADSSSPTDLRAYLASRFEHP